MHNGHGSKTKTKSKKYTSSASAGGYQSQVEGGKDYEPTQQYTDSEFNVFA